MAKPRKSAAPKVPAQSPQDAYAARKLKAGEHVQVKATLKTAADVETWRGLEARFPEETTGGLVKLALRELARKSNR